jgi:hypothetical protein
MSTRTVPVVRTEVYNESASQVDSQAEVSQSRQTVKYDQESHGICSQQQQDFEKEAKNIMKEK